MQQCPLPSHLHSMQSWSDVKADTNLSWVIFAGGCFWCLENIFRKEWGVVAVFSGYTGGKAEDAVYQKVAQKKTDHREAVQVWYDPRHVSFPHLLDVFWNHIDPTDSRGQFADRGFSYTTAIFWKTEEEKLQAEESRNKLSQSGRFDQPIVTEILPETPFFLAEEEHQQYSLKAPERYERYHQGSGRAAFLQQQEQKIAAEKKASLTPLQYEVTQKKGTEPPFQNAYWDEHREGIYVDIISGKPLFSSRDKFDSGTGWPSFSGPIVAEHIVSQEDHSHGMRRTEVSSQDSGSHLGHVFPDGPTEKGGQRYCINSASLRFIPRSEMKREGYSDLENVLFGS